MYQFKKQKLDWLDVFVARVKKGDGHLKMFSTPATPATQATLNIYAEGSFSFSAGDFAQEMGAGDSSLDLTIERFPAGMLAVERVLSDKGLRLCVSPSDPKTAWSRRAVKLKKGQSVTAVDGFVILPQEEVKPLTTFKAPRPMTVHVAERILPVGA